MTWLSDDELALLLRDLESQQVERKRSAGDRSGIRRNIGAFANDLAGSGRPGVIFVGVEDDGRCADLSVDDALLRTLAQMRSDGNLQPLPSLSVERKVFHGCEMVVVQVAPSATPPVRYQGRVWVKVGPTVQTATSEEEQRLTERRRGADLPFDLRAAPDAQLADLDLDYLRRTYVPAAISPEVLEQNQRPLEQQLRSLRLLAGEHPTWGALISCGIDPQGATTGATDYRNPLIAEIMHHLGFAQRFGMGLPIAEKTLSDNGNPPPHFVFTPTHVSVTVSAAA